MAGKQPSSLPDLWVDALAATKNVKEAGARRSDCREAYAYVVGRQGVGKTTLVHRCIQPGTERRGCDAVDFWSVRRSNQHGKTDVAKVWEFPGNEKLADVLASKNSSSSAALPAFFLPAKSINTAVVIIAVDLSRPSTLMTDCMQWLQRIRAALEVQYALLAKRNSPLPQQLKARAARVAELAGASSSKTARVAASEHTGIQIVIWATKYDSIRSQDLAVKAVISKALRCIAHSHGAHLIYSDFSQGTRDSRSSHKAETDALQQKAKALLMHILFAGLDRKSTALRIVMVLLPSVTRVAHPVYAKLSQAQVVRSRYGGAYQVVGLSRDAEHICRPVETFKALSRSKQHPEVSAEGPMCVLHGTDSFKSIGLPDGRPIVDAASALKSWQAEMSRTFPDTSGASGATSDLDQLPAEPSIDALVARLHESVHEAERTDIAAADRKRRSDSKRVSAASQGAMGTQLRSSVKAVAT